MSDKRLYVLLTVDWEADHGKWHYAPSPDDEDYGGVLVGTDGLVGLLDELGIPCTWLVECHMENKDRDLPRLFPEIVRGLSRRPSDEIGAHIHWIRRKNGKDIVSLEHTHWVEEQIQYASETLKTATGVTPVSFRGGAFLQVPRLPELLERYGYQNDATCMEPRLLRRLLGNPAQPYRCHPASTLRAGTSAIVEFPTHFRITAPSTRPFIDRFTVFHAKNLIRRFHTSFLNLYLHIDELTLPGSGRNETARLDVGMRASLRKTLYRLRQVKELDFLTMDHARQLLVDTLQPSETI